MPIELLETAPESPVRVSCVPDGPTALYRHFDADGKLLYVGISLSPVYRLRQHQAAAAWYPRIANVAIQWLETREAAAKAEREAIQAERPEFNIVHAQPVSARAAYLAELAEESCDELTYKVTRFQPAYAITEAARALSLPESAVRWAMAAGDLLYYPTGLSGVAITGWSLIAYLEALQAGAVKPIASPKLDDGRTVPGPSGKWLAEHLGEPSADLWIEEWVARRAAAMAEAA